MFEKLYRDNCVNVSDINEHLPIIYEYACKCKHITEMGVRTGVSTSAFLYADPDKLLSYDLYMNDSVKELFEYAKTLDKDYHYIEADTLSFVAEKTDLLFIDTLHTYDQIKSELSLHGNSVDKYMIFHDTETFGMYGQNWEGFDGSVGIWPAIEEYLAEHPEWKVVYKVPNNNGLTIIERV